MYKFKTMDVAKTKYQKNDIYVQIESVKGNKAYVWPLNVPDQFEIMEFPVSKLEYMPPIKVTRKQLKDFCRGEITLEKLKKDSLYLNVEADKPYQITLDDLYAAAKKFESLKDEGDTFFTWFTALSDELWDLVSMEKASQEPAKYVDDGLPAEHKVFENAWNELGDIYSYDTDAEFKNIADYIQTFYDNQKKSLLKRKFREDEELAFVMMWDRIGTISDQSKVMKKAWVKALEHLCTLKIPEALEIKAYACYGPGNGVYKQDYDTCRDCLLELLKIQADPSAANTLGYIYYYGRCTQGKPEYAKAFKYFSIGAAGGVIESRYKLADMFLNGYGVGKDPDTASRIIWDLYDESLQSFCKGLYVGAFADIALRAGSLVKDGVDCFPDYTEAYSLYLQARYALQVRMDHDDFFGDPIVLNHIEDAVAEILPDTDFEKPVSTVHYDSPYPLIQSGLHHDNLIEMTIKHLKGNKLQLTFKVKGNRNSEDVPEFLVTVPEAGTCGLQDKVTVVVKDITEFDVPADTDTILFNQISGTDFYFFGERVASIEGDYVYKVK